MGHAKKKPEAKAQGKNAGKDKSGKVVSLQELKDQKKADIKSRSHQCSVCRSMLPDDKSYKQHFESKHPKAPLPADLLNI